MEKNKELPPGIDYFDIETQFNFYLQLVNLDRRKMPPYQVREMRRAFYGAWGILLTVQSEKIAPLKEDDAVRIIEQMFQQVSKFWGTEIVAFKQNSN